MSEEMAVSDNATGEDATVQSDSATMEIVAEAAEELLEQPNEALPDHAEEPTAVTEETPQPNPIKLEPDPEPGPHTEETTTEIKIKDEAIETEVPLLMDIKDEFEATDDMEYPDDDKRGVKRRASDAFDDDVEFKGFEKIEDFPQLEYSLILQRLEAEVKAASKGFRPLRTVMATPCAPAPPSKRPRKDTDGSRPSSALSSRSEDDMERKKKTVEQIRRSKREAERKRRARIRADPVSNAIHRAKEKDRRQRRKEEYKTKNIEDLTSKEQRIKRKEWRERARKSRQDKDNKEPALLRRNNGKSSLRYIERDVAQSPLRTKISLTQEGPSSTSHSIPNRQRVLKIDKMKRQKINMEHKIQSEAKTKKSFADEVPSSSNFIINQQRVLKKAGQTQKTDKIIKHHVESGLRTNKNMKSVAEEVPSLAGNCNITNRQTVLKIARQKELAKDKIIEQQKKTIEVMKKTIRDLTMKFARLEKNKK